jgi:hypothetical protein
MILNAYAVLDAFVALLRLGLGLLVLGLGVAAWRTWRRRAAVPEDRKALEDRCYLLLLLGGFLLGLNVVAWPIFYLLLQSYVPEWPGVMCIYGVTRIGAGSLGPSRFLPPLVTALQVAKPALVFLSGAWFVLYLVNRRTRTAPLTGRVLLVLLAAGLLAVADAAAEVAYLAIPKQEERLSAGCCTGVFDAQSHAARFLPAALVKEDENGWLYAAYYALNAGLVLGADGCGRLCRRRLPRGWLVPLLLVAVLAVAVNAAFLVEVAAPRLLGLPYHHCPYDLVPKAPESLVAVALFLGGTFAVGWAGVAAWLGDGAEAGPLLPGTVGRLLQFAVFGYLLSLVMTSAELAATWWRAGHSG